MKSLTPSPLLPRPASPRERRGANITKTIILLFALFILFIRASYEDIVADKNRQIDYYQKKIEENKLQLSILSNENYNLNKAQDSSQQNVKMLEDFLNDFQGVDYLTPEQLAIETNMVLNLEEEVYNMQKRLRSKVISLYKYGKNYELELLLSSQTPNEFLRRNEYLQRFSQSRKKELNELRAKKFVINEKKKLIGLSTSSQRFYIETKREELRKLKDSFAKLNQTISSKNDEQNVLAKKIEIGETNQNRTRVFLSNFIYNRENYSGTKNNRLNYSTDDFSALNSKLNSPVNVNLISEFFGEQVNNSTRTKYYNSGITFSVAYGSNVYSVAGGIVSLVSDAPYFGKTIIINHGNGYRAVYSTLSETNLKPGDEVRANQIIGRTGETIDGQQLHFEIWLNDKPLNPMMWLREK